MTAIDPCQGCPRRHASGCLPADTGLQCPRGITLEPCDLCGRVKPIHTLQGGVCVDCRILLEEEQHERPDVVDRIPSEDICPPRCC